MTHRSPTRLMAPLLAALLLLGVAPGNALAATKVVKMGASYSFSPATVTLLTRGDAVRWRNAEDSPQDHDVYSDLAGYFHSAGGPGGIGPNESWTHVFISAGTFGYLCSIHAGDRMIGTVIVPIAVTAIGGGSRFRITVGSTAASTAYRNVIQVKKPGAAAFTALSTTTAASVLFTPHTHGTYQFRSAVRKTSSGALSGWSPTVSRSW